MEGPRKDPPCPWLSRISSTPWEQTGPATALGHYSHAGGTVCATLTFSPEGDLTGFTSGDRYQSADGKHFARPPWSTPAREHRQ